MNFVSSFDLDAVAAPGWSRTEVKYFPIILLGVQGYTDNEEVPIRVSFAAATGFVQRDRNSQKDLFLVKYQFEFEIVIVDGQLISCTVWAIAK